jgi:hypothetical protein
LPRNVRISILESFRWFHIYTQIIFNMFIWRQSKVVSRKLYLIWRSKLYFRQKMSSKFQWKLQHFSFARLNSLLLTVLSRHPSVFLRCMSLFVHTNMVTLLCPFLLFFSFTESMFLFACIFLFLNCASPLPSTSSPFPLCLFTLWGY